MNGAPDVYTEWDAAYVLGALSAEERRDYERHLATCAACARSVAELAGLPGLLAQVPAAEAIRLAALPDDADPDDADPDTLRAGLPDALPAGAGPPPGTLSRLLAAAHRRRRRTRGLVAGGIVLVAAAAASVAFLLPGWLGTGEQDTALTVRLAQVVPSPLHATVQLSEESWGTRIDASCSYAQTARSSGDQPYALYVTDRAGASDLVATWVAGPGTTVAPIGTTRFAEDDIKTVDIRWLPTGQVLLEAGLER